MMHSQCNLNPINTIGKVAGESLLKGLKVSSSIKLVSIFLPVDLAHHDIERAGD